MICFWPRYMSNNFIKSDPARPNPGLGESAGSGGKELAQSGRFVFFACLICLIYAIPLWRLFWYGWDDDAQSHILLVPIISGYLVATSGRQWRSARRTRPMLAIVPALMGMLAVGGLFSARLRGVAINENDSLSVMIFSFLCLLVAGGSWFLGSSAMKQLVFPAAFLGFMIPIPHAAMEGINMFLQHASAEAANMMLSMAGPPFVREGLIFQLPGITLMVAEECSGVRSTLVLFITSILASHLFLRSGWRRAILVAVVLPIAILRNGFRIYVIAMLCVHISPSMINSAIHHRGGPIFFGLSLIPLFALMVWLRKRETIVKNELCP